MVMFYFSATGNSKYIAELFCRKMNAKSLSNNNNVGNSISCKCHSIEEELDFRKLISLEEVIVFCYPVYGSRVPKLMREFAARYKKSLKNKKLIIFCTQMYFSGDGARAFTDIFPDGYVEVIYAEHFLMPNNICNLFFMPLASESAAKKYIRNAKQKMQTVCNDIMKGTIKRRGFNTVSRALGLIQGSFMPVIERYAKDKVWINKECNRCKLCVSICPMKNFEYVNRTISTKNNCMMCYRCINKCPQKAISVFLRRKVKKQFSEV